MRGEGWVEAARTLWVDVADEMYREPTAPGASLRRRAAASRSDAVLAALNGYLDAIAWRLRNDIVEDEFSAIMAQWSTQQPAEAASRLEHLLDATAAVSLAARRMRPDIEGAGTSLYAARVWQEAKVPHFAPPRAAEQLRGEAQFMALLDRRLASTPDLVRALALTNHVEATRLGAEHPGCDGAWLRAFDRLFFALDTRGRGHLHVPELGALALALAAAAAPNDAAPPYTPPALSVAAVRIAEAALSVRPPAQRRALQELRREVSAAVTAATGTASGVEQLVDLASAAQEAVPKDEADARCGPVSLRAFRRYCAAQELDTRRLRRITRHVDRVAAAAAAHWGGGAGVQDAVTAVMSPWREACRRALPPSSGRRSGLLRWFLLAYGEGVLGARTGVVESGNDSGGDDSGWGGGAVAAALFHGWRAWRLAVLASQQGQGAGDVSVVPPPPASIEAVAADGSGLDADRVREALTGMWAPQRHVERGSDVPGAEEQEEQEADQALADAGDGAADSAGNGDYSRILAAVTAHDEAVAAVAEALAKPEPA